MTRSLSMRDLAVPIGQAAMESLWLAAITAVVVALTAAPVRPAATDLAILEIAGALAARLCARAPRRFAADRWLLVPAGGVLVVVWLHTVIAADASWAPGAWLELLTTPWAMGSPVGAEPLVLLWLLAGYLACRGLILGTQAPSASRTSRWFVAGMVVFAALFAFVSGAPVGSAELPMVELQVLVMSYFAVGLATTALAHRHAVARDLRTRAPVTLSWALAIAVPIALVLAAGALIGRGTSALAWVWSVAVDLLSRTWDALHWLAAQLWWGLRWLASLLPSSSHAPTTTPAPDPGRWHDAAGTSHERRIWFLDTPTELLQWLLAIAIVVAMVLLLRRALRRHPAPATLAQDGESFSMWSWRMLLRQLSDAVKRLLGRRARVSANVAVPLEARPAETAARIDMRQIYRTLLRWASDQGHGRVPSTTPLEFARELAGAGISQPQIEHLTALYVAARYGAHELTDAQLDDARLAVTELMAARPSPGPGPVDR